MTQTHQNFTVRLNKPFQYGEHHFADGTWLQLHKSEIRLVGTDGMPLNALQFRSRAAAAEAWPILSALPSAAARLANKS